MTNPTKINLIKILYNSCYGGFNFSKEFAEKYKELYGDRQDDGTIYTEFFYDESFEIRCDADIIKVFEMLGTEKSSGENASLKIGYYPEELAEYISLSEYDGNESIGINFDKAYRKLLFEIVDNNHFDGHNKTKIERVRFLETKWPKWHRNIQDEIFNIL